MTINKMYDAKVTANVTVDEVMTMINMSHDLSLIGDIFKHKDSTIDKVMGNKIYEASKLLEGMALQFCDSAMNIEQEKGS